LFYYLDIHDTFSWCAKVDHFMMTSADLNTVRVDMLTHIHTKLGQHN